MNPSTLESYQAARALREQALELVNGVEAQADAGTRKAARLMASAWKRYLRRSALTVKAEDAHWGAL